MKRLVVLPAILFVFTFQSCKEKPAVPAVETNIVTQITAKTAVSGGVINNDGGADVVSQGICWNTSDNPDTDNNKTTRTEISSSFTVEITDLMPQTTYYVRAYATNSEGTGYGETKTFTTLGDTPAATIGNASDISASSAILNGSVNPNSLSTAVSFEWGNTTGYGNTIAAKQSPLPGESNGSTDVFADLNGLNPGTTYHFRVKAENSLGVTFSADAAFQTPGGSPHLNTFTIADINKSSAILKATINPNYFPTSVTFEYGKSPDYENSVLYSTTLTGSSDIIVNYQLSNLDELSVYHYRVIAENQAGKTVSEDRTFTTTGTVSDIDGNVYKTVLIGDQVWMAENLRTTRFPDGGLIFNGENAANICDNQPYYFRFNKDQGNVSVYGLLYNYYAASNSNTAIPIASNSIPSGIKGACPVGWHIPSVPEYRKLIDFLGGTEVAGGKLKSTELWIAPNQGASNSSNFSALPSGDYDSWNYGYDYMGMRTFFWSTSGSYDSFFGMFLNNSSQESNFIIHHRCNGAPIRCLRD